jgi:hypothetical protein
VPHRNSRAACPLDRRIKPRIRAEHFLDLKRLRHVVIRAAVDALDAFVPAAARGEHQHRQVESGPAPSAQDRQAVNARQSEVEDDGVVGFGAGQKVRPHAVRRHVHGITGMLQRVGQPGGQPRFVLDDENPHLPVIAQHALNGD